MATEPNNNLTHTPNGNANGDTTIQTLTVRMMMMGKEAGSIIGKKGDNVKKYREESGAKINISDSSCPERIVTVTGTTEQIYKAFSMITKKFEDDINTLHALQNNTLPKPPVTVRLIIPASQCGSLIGKGGSKIKEIRETTGASIQVASEMLPNSTERAVTVSGTGEAIASSIYHVCAVMLESPPKGATIPYRPKPAVPPVIYTPNGQAIAVQPGQFLADMKGLAGLPPGMMPQPGLVPYHHHHHQHQPGLMPPGMAGPVPGGFPRPPNMPLLQNAAQTHEMTIPNDLIGCIIGRGGSKINEIRQLSGATIKIANADEGTSDRKVTITGTPETINAAQYLINASIDLHKQLNLVAMAMQSAAAGAGDPSAQAALMAASNQAPTTSPTMFMPQSNPYFTQMTTPVNFPTISNHLSQPVVAAPKYSYPTAPMMLSAPGMHAFPHTMLADSLHSMPSQQALTTKLKATDALRAHQLGTLAIKKDPKYAPY